MFKYMQKALTEYAAGDDGTEFPAKDIDQLIVLLNSAVDEADDFLLSLGIDIGAIVAEASTLDRLDLLREAYNTIISNDENKDKFKVILNTLMNLYEASRPEIFEKNWQNEKFRRWHICTGFSAIPLTTKDQSRPAAYGTSSGHQRFLAESRG